MEDTKSFRVRQLSFDSTTLGLAINTLQSLKNRWPEKVAVAIESLEVVKDLLTEEGHLGYIPEVIVELISAVDLAEELEEKRLAEEETLLQQKLREGKEEIERIKEAEAKAKAAKIAKLKADIEELEV